MYGKGGIGKSTVSSNLTAALSEKGYKVLQIGCDPKHDSTRLLLNGEVKSTILDYMKDTPVDKRRLEDVVSVGYNGCLCAEAGGPEPGVGCAGRGIISSFDLLTELGGDSIERDVTLYDVLGDVVCGGFAVPLRNEYAELIYIVSSGEFMSIYAANNILKGICNYDPNRVGGIIFNSRGDPEEELRIKKFSEAVGIPIVASFERSELFMTAEENGKTVVELYPESGIASKFRQLADHVMRMERHHSHFLGERELEMCILGRSVKGETKKKIVFQNEKQVQTRKRYVSRNVLNNEPYGGCAFSGAQSVCSSIKGLTTILHAPRSCAQFAFQIVSSTYGRYRSYHIPLETFADPCVSCTDMTDSDMIFGGTAKLKERIEEEILKGNKDLAVITSCPSGIIGDDVKGVISSIRSENPDVRIADIEVDGNINGDFMLGVIDSGIEICETFSRECEKTDTVNLIGTKSLALNNLNSVSAITEMLSRLDIGVNCLLPACDSIESVTNVSSARLNIRMNPDLFTRQLCDYLKDRFDIDSAPCPIRPGIEGTIAWLTPVAEYFGKQEELAVLKKEIREEYDSLIQRYGKVLKGKRYCLLSATNDIDWILEALDAVGMVRVRGVIVDRFDYTNDMEIKISQKDIQMFKELDFVKEKEMIESLDPDIIISTMPLSDRIPHMPVPLVHVPTPFTGIDYIRRLSAIMVSKGREGWKKDVL